MNKILALLLIVGVLIRIFILSRVDFPLNQGGFFYSMIQDIIANDYRLPDTTTYNGGIIPFAYPPLMLYGAAFLNVFMGFPLLLLFKLIPFVFSSICVYLYYRLSLRILADIQSAYISTFIYLFSVSGYVSILEASGLLRAPALMFALITLIFVHKMYQKHAAKYVLLSGFFMGLTAMTHLEMAVFVTYSILAMYISFDRTWRGFWYSGFIGISALIISMPWWGLVVMKHGFEPFINAQLSNPWSITGSLTLQQAGLIRYIAMPLFDPYPTLVFTGLIITVVKRKWFPSLWFILLYLTASRLFYTTTGIIPLGMIAGYSIMTFMNSVKPILRTGFKIGTWKIHERYTEVIVYLVSGLFVCVCFFTVFIHPFTAFHAVAKPERNAMEWVRNNTSRNDEFIVVTPVPEWLWFMDNTAEWFPALAERKNYTTIQGREWTDTYYPALALLKELRHCSLAKDINCIEHVMNSKDYRYRYIYVRKPYEMESNFMRCCDLLENSLEKSPDFKLIYRKEGADIWEKKSGKYTSGS